MTLRKRHITVHQLNTTIQKKTILSQAYKHQICIIFNFYIVQ
jgi:hypothetical protein